MIILIVISIALVLVYVGFAIWNRKGLPESISAMVDMFSGAWRWLWSLWLATVAICTFAPAIDVLDKKGLAVLGFIPMVLLGFVAVMPIFDTEHKKVHDIFGILAGVASQVAMAFMCVGWLMVWMLFVFVMGSIFVQPDGWLAKAVKGNGTFVAEMMCWITVIGAALTAM